MPTLTIDGTPVEAQSGQTILEAARDAGIEIPTLCWYPKLPVVGNCRLCVVDVQGNDKLLPACATTAADGMEVTTESDRAVDARRGVLEFLLERYPGEHLANGGREKPQNEFEDYVVRYGVIPKPRTLDLRRGDRIRYPFRADRPVRFDIHYHDGFSIRHAVERTTDTILPTGFSAGIGRQYCLMWFNEGLTRASVTYRVDGP